jgi:uncharacterized protein DUF2867
VLRAQMKLPGEAELEFVIEPIPDRPDRCRLVQTARFRPRGLAGLTYWYAVLPFHRLVFDRMLDGIRHAAEGRAAPTASGASTGPGTPTGPGKGRTRAA